MLRPGSTMTESPLASRRLEIISTKAPIGGDFSPRLIRDTEAAAEIEMRIGIPCARSSSASSSTLSTLRGSGSRSRICDPMWQLTPSRDEFRKLPRAVVDGWRLGDVDTEFVLAQAGRDVGVRGRRRRRDSRGWRCRPCASASGHWIDHREFGFRFAIEAVNAVFQRVLNFRGGFADAGKDHLSGIAAGLQDAIQFAARHDVEAGARFGEQGQDSQRRIGFHGVADRVRQVAERLVYAA